MSITTKYLLFKLFLILKKQFFNSYVPKDPSMNSETYHYKKGANQLFMQTSHIFDPTPYSDEELSYNTDKEVSLFS